MTTLEPEPDPAELALNDIGEIRLQTSGPLVFDGYSHQPADRLVHPDRAGHQRHRRRRHALPAGGSGQARIQRFCDLKYELKVNGESQPIDKTSLTVADLSP